MILWFNKVFWAIRLAIGFIALLWGVHAISALGLLDKVGIIPRSQSGVLGILLAPLLHANLHHLLANSIGMAGFFVIFALAEAEKMLTVFTVVYLVHGLLVWVVARPGNHLGASGLVFGLFGYLVFLGFFKKQLRYLLISACVLCLYGGMFWGVLPVSSFVSWESHLCGLLTGAVLAKYL